MALSQDLESIICPAFAAVISRVAACDVLTRTQGVSKLSRLLCSPCELGRPSFFGCPLNPLDLVCSLRVHGRLPVASRQAARCGKKLRF